MGKKILITGANGFIGKAVSSALQQAGDTITALDISFNDTDRSRDTITGDITNYAFIKNVFESDTYDVVVHLGAILAKGNDADSIEHMMKVNVQGTAHIAAAATEFAKSDIIFFSTAMVYGNHEGPFVETMPKDPQGYYALTKSMGEDIVKHECMMRGCNYTIFRPSIIYGESQKGSMYIPSLIEKALCGETFAMTKGKQKRDFIHIDDVVSAVLLAVTNSNNSVYNLSYGSSVEMKSIPEIVQNILPDFSVTYAVPYRDNEIWDYALDNSTLKQTGWAPHVSLETGLTRIIQTKKEEVL